MALAWTTDELLADIRDQGRIADNDPEATDAILLKKATRLLHKVFMPRVRKARAEWYQATKDYTIVAGRDLYPIPRRAFMSTVRGLFMVDTVGREWPLYPVPVEDARLYSGVKGFPEHYTIRDNRIQLLPAPSSTDKTLRVYFEVQPAQLVPTTSCTRVLAANDTDLPGYINIVTANTWNPAVGSRQDVVAGNAPFSPIMVDAVLSSRTATPTPPVGDENNYFVPETALYRVPTHATSADPGDWLCVAGESPIPQIPAEFHPTLALAVVVEWLAPIDPTGSAQLGQQLAAQLKEMEQMLSPRQIGTSMKMKSTHSLLRRGVVRRGGTFSDWRP